jgi:hypothetical protein
MIKTILPLVVFVATSTSFGSGSFAHLPPSRLFLLSDSGRNEWCIFANEQLWRSQVESTGASLVATMDILDGHLKAIDLTTEDEAGDWMVFDHYTIAVNGDLQDVRRKSNILPGDRSVVETYSIAEGKAKLLSRTTTSLSTGKKLTNPEDWLPEVPITTRINDFPFAPLAKVTYAEILSKRRICTIDLTSAAAK